MEVDQSHRSQIPLVTFGHLQDYNRYGARAREKIVFVYALFRTR